jgi:hypothetical protein
MASSARLVHLVITALVELPLLCKCALLDFTHHSVNHHALNALKVFLVQIQLNLQLHAQILPIQ